MELRWKKAPDYPDLDLFDGDEFVGWIEARAQGLYAVQVVGTLSNTTMPCEEEYFVSLRKAMRALKDTVTVLLIGRKHGV